MVLASNGYGVAVVLQWCHDGIVVVLQWCNSALLIAPGTIPRGTPVTSDIDIKKSPVLFNLNFF
jgi:hypothetical protein